MKIFDSVPGCTVYCGHVLTWLRKLKRKSVQCWITSPPYWGLRNYGVPGQLGLEATPEEYVANMVEVFMEAYEVLRDDGILYLNIGDTAYVGRGASKGVDPKDTKRAREKNVCRPNDRVIAGYKQKDIVGIPWMLAFALRDAGWYLRSEIIWAKPNPMTDSVKDRPTKAHEQIFLLTKQKQYFYDYVGSLEEAVGKSPGNKSHKQEQAYQDGDRKHRTAAGMTKIEAVEKRNQRSVWRIGSYSLKEKHFAAFPPELVRKCLSAGISEFGCCNRCGAPYKRLTKKERIPTRPGIDTKVTGASSQADSPYHDHNGTVVGNRDPLRHIARYTTIGNAPSCDCIDSIPVPCTVGDFFHGAGTTMKVCQRLGLNYIGIELNEEYINIGFERPDVVFPHERKPKTKRRRKGYRQQEFFQ